MSIRRVGVLLIKDLVQGPKDFIFIFVLVAPVVMSLVVSLVFGTLFSDTPKLGIVDDGDSEVAARAQQLSSVVVRDYDTRGQLREAVESGALDMGIVLPREFDAAVAGGERTELVAYTWGQSLAMNRLILRSTILDVATAVAGNEAPIDFETVTVGDEKPVPWSDRLLPFLVLYAVMAGGAILGSTALVSEKEKNTIRALVVTPTSIGEVFASKGALGAILALIMGIVMLVMNQVFGTQPVLLVALLALGSVMASLVGLILGFLVRDLTTLFSAFKTIGIILYAPAIIYMFPQIPQWIGRFFPTYYLVGPVVEISQNAAGWSDIASDVYILMAVDAVLVAVVALLIRRLPQYAI